MAENTKISWADHTFNPWVGCAKVNEGCKNCYAETLMDLRYGRVKWGPNGTRSRTKTWNDPPRWNRQAAELGERRKVFCASLADVFEDFQGPVVTGKGQVLWYDGHGRYDDVEASGFNPLRIATIDLIRRDLFKLIDRCGNLDFLLLTKRPENVRPFWQGPNRGNCWIGTSVANQDNADEFIPRLLACRGLGPVLFLSVEPQVGPIDLSRFLFPRPAIDWVILGGESRQAHGDPRPFNLDWARLLVGQCRDAGVPVFVKQMGSAPVDGRTPLRLADSHGDDWAEWPEELRVRECPESYLPQLVA